MLISFITSRVSGRALKLRNRSTDCGSGIMSRSYNAAPKVILRMTFFIILFLAMAGSAVESAATGRALLSAKANDTAEATSMSQATGTQWVQVTAVPLGVFLVGACLWSIIQNTAAYCGTILNVCGRRAPKVDHQRPVENHLICNVRDVGFNPDQEAGLQLPHCPIDADGLAATLNSPTDARDGMQPEFNASNDEEAQDVGAYVQTQL